MKNRLPLTPGAALLFAMLSGCDSGRAAVRGSVTHRGQPVEAGSISFEPVDGRGGTAGGAIQNGEFQLSGDTGVFPGKKRVIFMVVQKTGKQIPAGPPLPKGTMVDEVKSYYPPTQEAEVVAGKENEFEFKL